LRHAHVGPAEVFDRLSLARGERYSSGATADQRAAGADDHFAQPQQRAAGLGGDRPDGIDVLDCVAPGLPRILVDAKDATRAWDQRRASFDKLRMRDFLCASRIFPHPLMSAFARCGRSFFSRCGGGACGGDMDRCTGLGAGIAATVDRSLMRWLATNMILVSSRGCLALSTSMGMEALPG
jgi:hypothetical protein